MDMVRRTQLLSDDHSQVIISHVLDQMRMFKEEAERNSSLWRRSMLETEALRKEAVALREAREFMMERMAFLERQREAVEGSHLYQFVLRCRRLRESLLPPGGLAERILLAPLGLASHQRAPAAVPDPIETITEEESAASLSAPHLETSAPTHTSASSEGPKPSAWELPEEIAAFPLQWQHADRNVDNNFLNLVILSAKPRSGSTLLQRICNARKGSLIWGEHGGALTYFADIYRNAANFCLLGESQRNEYFEQDENPNLWIANMCPNLESAQKAIIASVQAFLQSFYSCHRENHDILGFKEVAYGQWEVELLRRCYPEAHFLLLIREPVRTWNSTPRDWFPSLELWAQQWRERAEWFQQLAAADDRCHLVRYEDIVAQKPATIRLLQSVAKVTPAQISMVLGNKIGSRNLGVSDTERQIIFDESYDQMTKLNYAT